MDEQGARTRRAEDEGAGAEVGAQGEHRGAGGEAGAGVAQVGGVGERAQGVGAGVDAALRVDQLERVDADRGAVLRAELEQRAGLADRQRDAGGEGGDVDATPPRPRLSARCATGCACRSSADWSIGQLMVTGARSMLADTAGTSVARRSADEVAGSRADRRAPGVAGAADGGRSGETTGAERGGEVEDESA